MPDKGFKVVVIKILTGLEKRVNKLSENFNRERERKYKKEPEMKNSMTDIEKYTRGNQLQIREDRRTDQ